MTTFSWGGAYCFFMVNFPGCFRTAEKGPQCCPAIRFAGTWTSEVFLDPLLLNSLFALEIFITTEVIV